MNEPRSHTDAVEPRARAPRWRFGDCVLDGATLELRVGGQLVKLEPKPLDLLMFLLRHPGEVVTKDELQDGVWPGRVLSESVLTKAVAKLRQGLGDEQQAIIKTVHGYGYRLIAPVTLEAAEPGAPLAPLPLQPGDSPPLRPLWTLQARLGSGGYGEVWLAAHAKTHERRVFKFARDAVGLTALKREITLFRVLTDTYGPRRDVVALLDWNLEELPYFVEAEHVAGGALPQWAQAQGGVAALPLATRLELVAQAAEALSAAHAAGVLHKDIKPANLLVASGADGAPQLKLADFGSGRMLDLARLEHLEITRIGFTQALDGSGDDGGTPLYLAPELRAGPQPTAQSDLYALGVILYQLVVADLRRPVAPGWEREIDDELLREDIGLAAAGNPADRLGDAAELARRLRTLDSRRSRLQVQRQAQAEAKRLRAALQRSRIRRRWQQALVATLLVGLGLSSWGFWSARRAADEARAAVEFVSEDLLAATDPFGGGRPTLSLQALLNEAAPRLDQRLAAHPLARAEMAYAMGRAYEGLGDWTQARAQLEAALRDSEAEKGADAELSLRIADRLAHVAMLQTRYDESAAIYQRSYALRRARLGERHPDTLTTRAGLAWLDFEQGRYAQAAALYEVLLKDYRGSDPDGVVDTQWSLADCYLELNRPADAEALMRQVVAASVARHGARHPHTLWQQITLGDTVMTQARWDEAAAIFDDAYQQLLHGVGELHPYTLTALHYRGQLLLERGEAVAALPLLRRAYDNRMQVHGAGHVWTRYSANRVGETLTRLGLAAEALPLLQATYEQGLAAQGARHPNVLLIQRNLAEALIAQGQLARAETLLLQGLDDAGRSLPAGNVRIAYLHESLGRLRALQRRPDEAQREYARAGMLYRAALGEAHPLTQRLLALR